MVVARMSLFVLSLLLLQLQVKATLMGVGLSNTWMERQHQLQRPKEAHHREVHTIASSEERPTEKGELNSNRPCVGLCYYEKLMALEGKLEADKSPNDTIQDEDKAKQKPCVGLCQYYKSLGLQDPHDLKQLKRNQA